MNCVGHIGPSHLSHILMRTLMIVMCVGIILAGALDAVAERQRRMIPRTEFELFVVLLRLDDNQRSVAEQFYEVYRAKRLDDELGERAREYNDAERAAIVEVNDLIDAGHDPGEVASRIYGELDLELDTLNPLLELVDQELLQNLESLLTHEQQPRMMRVRNMRQRRNHTNGNPKMPGAGVDIFSLLYAADPITAESPAFDAFFAQIEPRYVAALQHHSDTERRVGDDVRAVMSIGYEMRDESLSEAQRATLLDKYRRTRLRYMAPKIEAAEAIVRLNRRALAELESILSEEQHRALVTDYHLAAYPKIHPDPASAESMIQAALNLEDIEEYQVDAITGGGDVYRRQHAAISGRMVKTTDKFWKLRGLAKVDKRDDMFAASATIIDLGVQREELSDRLVLKIESVLMPEQFALLPKWPGKHKRPWARP